MPPTGNIPERELGDRQADDEDDERARFLGFAGKLVQVPKKEIDEKAEEWKRERGRKR